MEDLIRRADAIKAEADRVYEVLHPAGCKESYEDCLKDAVKTFKDIPSAEPKQGEWIEEIGDCEGKSVRYICSQCGDDDGWINYKYCPICGCRMKGADDE